MQRLRKHQVRSSITIANLVLGALPVKGLFHALSELGRDLIHPDQMPKRQLLVLTRRKCPCICHNVADLSSIGLVCVVHKRRVLKIFEDQLAVFDLFVWYVAELVLVNVDLLLLRQVLVLDRKLNSRLQRSIDCFGAVCRQYDDAFLRLAVICPDNLCAYLCSTPDSVGEPIP